MSEIDSELRTEALIIDMEAQQVVLESLLGAIATRTPTIFADWEAAVEKRLELMAVGARLASPGRQERVRAVEAVVRSLRAELSSKPWPIRRRASRV